MSPMAVLQAIGAVQGVGGGAVLVVVGLVVLGLWSTRSGRRLRAMLGTRTTTVADVSEGPVELEGTVKPADQTFSTRSRMTDESDAVLAEFRRNDRPDNDPHHDDTDVGFPILIPQQLAPDAASERTAVPFYLEDDSGRILVDAAHANLSLETDAKRNTRNTSVDADVRVEAVVLPDEDIYAVGTAVPAEEYADRVRPRLFNRGKLGWLTGLFGGDYTEPADAALDEDDEWVLTRTAGDDVFVLSDTAEWRTWIRQVLMLLFWTVIGLGCVAGGLYLAYLGVS